MVDERRRNADRVEEKLDQVIDMLSVHITGEEHMIFEIKEDIRRYFGELDAHIHKHHHAYLEEEIEDKKQSEQWWNKLKQGVAEKIILLIIGALASYAGHAIIEDMKKGIHNGTPTQIHCVFLLS